MTRDIREIFENREPSKLIFNAEAHEYRLGAVKVPSVTTILANTSFKGKYSNIPKHILEQAAAAGTRIHEAIETDDTSQLKLREQLSYDQWIKIKEQYGFLPLTQEQRVHYGTLYCGTFDMIAMDRNEKLWLLDVKTTAVPDSEYVSQQLTMYEEAYYDMYGDSVQFDHLGMIWVPRGKVGKLIPVDRTDLEVIQSNLDEFRDSAEDIELAVFEFVN